MGFSHKTVYSQKHKKIESQKVLLDSSFTVYATDNGTVPKTDNAPVIVWIDDENDNNPVFSSSLYSAGNVIILKNGIRDHSLSMGGGYFLACQKSASFSENLSLNIF